MISACHISKSFGSLRVLRDINLDIPDHKVVTITGSSGAGKSTLLQILGTLMKPDEGTLRIGDTAIESLSDRQLANFRNRQIGFVFQFHHLLPEFSALENVSLPALIGGARRADAEGRARELLTLLGLSDRMSHHPSELSGGEQQRVAVARALINRPQVVFADEPSGNLDTANKQLLHQLFFQLSADLGQTFVVVTHDMQLADMADVRFSMYDCLISPSECPASPVV